MKIKDLVDLENNLMICDGCKKRIGELDVPDTQKDKEISELVEALEMILFWKDKANTTPSMLLSSRHDKSDECVTIMKNYENSFKQAKSALNKHKTINK